MRHLNSNEYDLFDGMLYLLNLLVEQFARLSQTRRRGLRRTERRVTRVSARAMHVSPL